MSVLPIFLVTHPRSCSTAFERVSLTCFEDIRSLTPSSVFMTRSDVHCVHEPFGDAFYYGPERLSRRFEGEEATRTSSGFGAVTYQDVLRRMDDTDNAEKDKRLFIKDMAYYLVPPDGRPASIAPSLARIKRGIGTSATQSRDGSVDRTSIPDTKADDANPTVIPSEILDQFQFTILIRNPASAIPSYYRCTKPPLDSLTGFYEFLPSEAGYKELRSFHDYLQRSNEKRNVGGDVRRPSKEQESDDMRPVEPTKPGNTCVIDADDLLNNPAGVIRAYCQVVGLEFHPSMLQWDTEQDKERAAHAFEKWKGFHEDAIDSTDLKPRRQLQAQPSRDEEDAAWTERFGSDGAKVIRATVDANLEDYEYLKQFKLKVRDEIEQIP